MTEAEWLACEDPKPMLHQLREEATERKLRLFACACSRLVWHLLIDERSRSAVETAELYADGLLTVEEAQVDFREACDASRVVFCNSDEWPETTLNFRRRRDLGKLFRATCIAAFAVGKGVRDTKAHIRSSEANLIDGLILAALIRCIFRNPFRLVTIDRAWLTWNGGAVPKLAQTIYDERAFSQMPALADALTEAGCSNDDILSHCRSGTGHVRGCWVVDLLLGKQ